MAKQKKTKPVEPTKPDEQTEDEEFVYLDARNMFLELFADDEPEYDSDLAARWRRFANQPIKNLPAASSFSRDSGVIDYIRADVSAHALEYLNAMIMPVDGRTMSEATRAEVIYTVSSTVLTTMFYAIASEKTIFSNMKSTPMSLIQMLTCSSFLATMTAVAERSSFKMLDMPIIKEFVDRLQSGRLMSIITPSNFPMLYDTALDATEVTGADLILRRFTPPEEPALQLYFERKIEDARADERMELKLKLESIGGELHVTKHMLDTANADIAALQKENASLQKQLEHTWTTETDKLKEDLAHARQQIAVLEATLDERDRTHADAQRDFERKADDINARARELSQVVVQPTLDYERFAEIITTSDFFHPETPMEAIELAQAAFPDVFGFSRRALDDAEDWTGDPEELWTLLRLLALHFYSDACAGRPPECRSFTQAHGYELSSNESRSTRKSKKYMAMRTATYNGKSYTAQYHIKGKKLNTTDLLRIHFDVDADIRKLVVCRCGGHVETAGSHRHGY